MWIAAFYILQLITYPRRERPRLKATYGIALAIITPPILMGGSLHPIGLAVLFGIVSVVITVFEVQRRSSILTGVYSEKENTDQPVKRRGPREYSGRDVIVLFDPAVCTHSAVCLARLPKVFNLRNRPWINADGANAEAVISTIELCPSGALSYRQSGDSTLSS